MNLLAQLPTTAARLEISMNVEKMVAEWKRLMIGEKLEHYEFRTIVSDDHVGSFVYAYVRMELLKTGFEIDGLAAYPVGVSQDGKIQRHLCFYVRLPPQAKILSV